MLDNQSVLTQHRFEDNGKTRIVLFSGGLSSFEMGRRVLKTYGEENVRFWFFDTLIEDEDVYGFITDAQEFYRKPIEFFKDGRNPWQVFRDERFIGNSRVPLCNRVLKREVLEDLLRKKFPQKDVILCLGYEHREIKRMDRAKLLWLKKGYDVEFPLVNPPYMEKSDLLEFVSSKGLIVPKLYKNGFTHNNCGGACVQAGIFQWSKLWKEFPERYLWHEQQEIVTREYLQKDVSILRERKNNLTKPLTLKRLRCQIDERI